MTLNFGGNLEKIFWILYTVGGISESLRGGESFTCRVDENQQNSVSEYTDSFTLMISFVLSS